MDFLSCLLTYFGSFFDGDRCGVGDSVPHGGVPAHEHSNRGVDHEVGKGSRAIRIDEGGEAADRESDTY